MNIKDLRSKRTQYEKPLQIDFEKCILKMAEFCLSETELWENFIQKSSLESGLFSTWYVPVKFLSYFENM